MNDHTSSQNGRRRRAIDDFSIKLSTIRIWMHEKDIGKLTRVLWAGQGNRLRQQASTNPRVKRFLAAVPYVMNDIKDVHQAVIDNSLETLQAKLEPPVPHALITGKDANGLNVVHKAAGLGYTKILEYLISMWPEGANEADITGKTPLHWAASAKNNMRCYTILTQSGCDEEAVDYKMKTPSYYRHKPQEIERAFLIYVPDAPRVSPDVSTDWDALCPDDASHDNSKKSDIKVPPLLNGIGGRGGGGDVDNGGGNDDSTENTSELDLNESASQDDKIIEPLENGNATAPVTPEAEETTPGEEEEEASKEEENPEENSKPEDENNAEAIEKTEEEKSTNESQANGGGIDKQDGDVAQAQVETKMEVEKDVEKENDNKKTADDSEKNEKEPEGGDKNQNDSDNEIVLQNGNANDELHENDPTVNRVILEVPDNEEERISENLENDLPAALREEYEKKKAGKIIQQDQETGEKTCVAKEGKANEGNYKENENHEKEGNEEYKDEKYDSEELQNGEKQSDIEEDENENMRNNIERNKEQESQKDERREPGRKEPESKEPESKESESKEQGTESSKEHKNEENKELESKENKSNDHGKDVSTNRHETHDNQKDVPEKAKKIERNPSKEEENELKKAPDDDEDNDKDDSDNDSDSLNDKADLKRPTSQRKKVNGDIDNDDDDEDLIYQENELNTNDDDDDEEEEDAAETATDVAENEDLEENNGMDDDEKLDENHNDETTKYAASSSSPTSSLAIEGFVQGESGDNTVQSQSAEIIDEESRIREVVASGDMEQLAQIVLNGDGNKLVGLQSPETDIQAFLSNVPNYMSKIRRVHEAAREGSLLSLQQALDRRKFAVAKDEISPNGATPLHVAVLFGHSDIVRYLAARFPETTTIADSDNRTALHYAATIKDNGHFYNMLTQLGANPKTKDKLGHTPEFYLESENSSEILTYRQLLSNFGAEDLEEELLSDQGQAESNSLHANPIFKTEQGKYLANTLAKPLIEALTEIANKRPDDPVSYLAGYLQSYMHSQHPKTAGSGVIGISRTNSSAFATSGMNGKLGIDETDEIPGDESDEGTAPSSDDRDEHGQSVLHFACARSHRRGGLLNLIEESSIDITYRDELYRTARDVSLQANQPGNAREIDRYVLSLAVVGDVKPFEHFAIVGYDHIVDISDDSSKGIIDIVADRGHDELAELLRSLRPLEESREELHQMIRDNNVDRVKEIANCSDGKWLLKAKNYYGRTAIHIAVLKESEEIVEFFLELFPEIHKIGDNLERTALHYAMGTNAVESLSHILITKGAKRTVKDLKGRQPSYYFMNKADIMRLQEEEDENR